MFRPIGLTPREPPPATDGRAPVRFRRFVLLYSHASLSRPIGTSSTAARAIRTSSRLKSTSVPRGHDQANSAEIPADQLASSKPPPGDIIDHESHRNTRKLHGIAGPG